MVLDNLSGGLRGLLDRIKGANFVDKKLVKEILKELQKTLIAADVNIRHIFELSQKIEKRALEEKLPPGISRKEQLVKVLYGEIAALMGESKKFDLNPKKQNKLLLVGVQGSGKTTTCAKLARYFNKRGMKSAMICTDVFRPGAYEQLKQLGEEINIPVYGEPGNKDAVKIAKNGLQKFGSKYNVLIFDSEGRHSLDKQLMEDIKKLSKFLDPENTVLVLDATIGQQAETQARAFKESCGVDSIILTKLDGAAKGGGSISACSAAQAPVVLVGLGERIDELEELDPQRFLSRLMGFGDLKGLLERFQESVEQEKVEDISKRMMTGDISLIDVYEQLEQMKKMGPLDKVVDMLPFGAKIPKNMLQVQEGKMEKFKPIINSMTLKEIESPKLSRAQVERIASGSGTKPEDVRALLHQYNQMRAAIKKIRKDRRFTRMLKSGDFGSLSAQ